MRIIMILLGTGVQLMTDLILVLFTMKNNSVGLLRPVVVFDILAYWTQSLTRRQRDFLPTSHGGPSFFIDEETRHILQESNLLIPRRRLLVLDSIGQGEKNIALFACVTI